MLRTARPRTPALGNKLGDDFGDKFGYLGDKSKIPENSIVFSITLLGEEINRMYWMIPCDVTTSRTMVYKRWQLKGASSLELRLQCELENW
ncbi:hypothetical protein AVEN_150608-1 [Araneus ventricosus]|uniref:Uncharacterized protein n=1 Tax=Araneus ventricosus TaxID=182803 RepID=A0A4Y2GKS9_ARAVE|nr:hypothetical protein AVEN_150608-1 [Araneus ventricosus]